MIDDGVVTSVFGFDQQSTMHYPNEWIDPEQGADEHAEQRRKGIVAPYVRQLVQEDGSLLVPRPARPVTRHDNIGSYQAPGQGRTATVHLA